MKKQKISVGCLFSENYIGKLEEDADKTFVYFLPNEKSKAIASHNLFAFHLEVKMLAKKHNYKIDFLPTSQQSGKDNLKKVFKQLDKIQANTKKRFKNFHTDCDDALKVIWVPKRLDIQF